MLCSNLCTLTSKNGSISANTLTVNVEAEGDRVLGKAELVHQLFSYLVIWLFRLFSLFRELQLV